MLGGYGLGQSLRLDFSIVNDRNYYSGIIFQGYLPGLASAVLAGGRYDNLLKKMGRTGGAIGFAVYLDQFQRLFSRPEGYDADVLLINDSTAGPRAVAAAVKQLTDGGESVVVRSAAGGGKFRRTLRINAEGGLESLD